MSTNFHNFWHIHTELAPGRCIVRSMVWYAMATDVGYVVNIGKKLMMMMMMMMMLCRLLMSADEEEEESRSCYERYRILVQNECAGGPSTCLSIYLSVCLSLSLSLCLSFCISVSLCIICA